MSSCEPWHPSRVVDRSSSGRASARTKIGDDRAHVSRCSMKSSRPWSAHCRSQKTSIVVDCSATRSKKVRHAANSSSRDSVGSSSTTEQAGQPRLDPAALRDVRDDLLEQLADPATDGIRVVGVGDPGPPADDLGERPVADPLAVGGRATLVPQDRLDEHRPGTSRTPTRACSCRCRPVRRPSPGVACPRARSRRTGP